MSGYVPGPSTPYQSHPRQYFVPTAPPCSHTRVIQTSWTMGNRLQTRFVPSSEIFDHRPISTLHTIHISCGHPRFRIIKPLQTCESTLPSQRGAAFGARMAFLLLVDQLLSFAEHNISESANKNHASKKRQNQFQPNDWAT